MQCRRVSQGSFVLGVFVLVPTLLLAQVRQFNFRHQGSGGGASAATDPGPRGGAAGAGGSYDGLTTADLAAFNAAMTAFMETDSVTGSIAGADNQWCRRGISIVADLLPIKPHR
jgi:hypothetical protein